ncbi:MAG: amidohydrolase family protein [Advenella sp.]
MSTTPTLPRTLIENGTVIAWQNGRHSVLTDDAVLAFHGSDIIYVGPRSGWQPAPGDHHIDARGQIVMPGLINTHLHVTDTPFTRGRLEEPGARTQGAFTNYGPLYQVLPAVRNALEPEDQLASAQCAFAELARTGSTTVVEMGYDFEVGGNGDIAITKNVADIGIQTGLRVYSAPRYRKFYYGAGPQGKVWYKTYPNDGRSRMQDCFDFCAHYNGRHDDRLRTMLAPGQIDTCDPAMLRETRQFANVHHLPIQIHAGQSPKEFERLRSEYGRTTIEYLADTGLLGPDLLIGHGQIMTADGNLDHLSAHEAHALQDSGTTVAHLPWVKARRGGIIDSIFKYRSLGVRQSLGTDTFPFDLFNDMRFALVMCRTVEQAAETMDCQYVFHMATTGGADALNRPDLGRLAAGCKADIVLLRADTFKAAPIHDPFLFIVLAANGEDVDQVIVDGRSIVKNGRVLTVNAQDAVARLNEAALRVSARVKR